MAKMTSYMFLVDDITALKAEALRKALLSTSWIADVSIKMVSGVVTINSSRDPEADLKMACSIAGCSFRMKVSKRKANYWA